MAFRAFPCQPRLRRARRVPCLCQHSASHARDCFRVRARAELLFSQTSRKPVSCSLRRGGNLPGTNFHEYAKRGAERTPTHRNARKAELCSLAFRAFPLSAGGLRPNGRLSRPAARKRGEISERAQAYSLRAETLEKLSFAPWLFKRFPYLPAVCGPNGR